MQLPVVDMNGASVGTLEVSDQLFGVPMNASVVHQAMVMQQANLRRGTSSTKTRAMVSGGGIKPRPQKHTGRARQGSIRAPHWKGGGVVFGPHPRSFRQRMPKKMRRLAIRCMLSDKARGDRLVLVETLDIPEAKTQAVKRVLQAMDALSTVLLVTDEASATLVLASRNLEGVKTLPATNLNTLDLLHHDRLIMTVGAVRKAEELWGGGAGEGGVVVSAPRPTRRRRARGASGAAGETAAPQTAAEQPSKDEEA